MPQISITQASGRYDRPIPALDKDLDTWRGESAIVSLTEQTGKNTDRTAAYKAQGWQHYFPGVAGADCVLLWATGTWTALRARTVQVVPAGSYISVSGKIPRPKAAFHATVVDLRRSTGEKVSVWSLHWPLRNTARRRRAWDPCATNLAREIHAARKADPRQAIILACDFNADHRNSTERALLRGFAKSAGVTLAWDKNPVPVGGPRVIDGFAASGLDPVRSERGGPVPSSDHLPVRGVFNTAKPKVDYTSAEWLKKIDLGKDTSGRPLEVDRRTKTKIENAERRLGHKFTIVQGSYRAGKGAKASAGTHDKAGVVDLRSRDLPATVTPQRAVQVLREEGLIAWYRTKAQGFEPHIHAIDYGNPGLAASASKQVTAWANGKNGLASGAPDDGARVKIPKDPQPQATVPKKPTPKPTTPKPAPAPPKKPTPPKPAPKPAGKLVRRLDGIDISRWQKQTIDYTKAKAAGVRFIYHKATEGTTVKDPNYTRRREEAARADIPFGAYHFARPDKRDAVAEAKHFLATAKPRPGDLRPCLDLEDRGHLNRAELTAWVRSFAKIVLEATGRTPVLYLASTFDLDDTCGCPLWVARYSNADVQPVIPKPWTTAAMWQHGNGVDGPIKTVPGVGAVDVNALYIALDSLRIKATK